MSILPSRSRRRWSVTYAHRANASVGGKPQDALLRLIQMTDLNAGDAIEAVKLGRFKARLDPRCEACHHIMSAFDRSPVEIY
jgi:hypothetical protein